MLVIVACLVIAGAASVSFHTGGARAATAPFNQNLVMSDGVFDASGTMTTAQIQAKLNASSNSCLKNYTATVPTGYSTYTTTTSSAATVIQAAATLWGVNPQVLLVTLEKEQGLVTGGSGCSSWRYWAAMGYNCPDGSGSYSYPALGITSTCVKRQSDAGFAAQVNHGAWQLAFNRQRAEGNLYWNNSSTTSNYGFNTAGYRQAYAGAPSIYYDGWYTISGVAVYMTNGATASLYSYTPYVSANQGFYSLFTSWFGSTTTPTGTTVSPTTAKTPPTTKATTTTTTTTVPLTLSGADGAYVDSVYRLFVGRPSTTGEKSIWATSFATGGTKSAFVNFLLASPEYWRYEVARDYVLILHRAADAGGLNLWSARLAANGRNDSVLAGFAGSDEYFRSRSKNDNATYLTNLYLDFLNRNVDPSGFAHWMAILTNGSMSRTAIATSILQSGEYRTQVVNANYLRVLGRSADVGGRTHWVAVYQAHRRESDVQAGLALSGEGVAYLSSLR